MAKNEATIILDTPSGGVLTMAVNVKITKNFQLRMLCAHYLIELAARIMGFEFEFFLTRYDDETPDTNQ